MEPRDEEKSLAGRLVKVIETRAADIARAWYSDVKDSHYTPTFQRISHDDAVSIAMNVYQKLGYWLRPGSEEEIRAAYENFGQAMFNKGFRLEEVVMTLILIKRHLWLHLLEEGLMATDLQIYQALELNNKVVLYFDRAIYFAVIGYKTARDKSRREASA